MNYRKTTIILFCIFPIFCKAHDQPVHELIAQSAAFSSTGLMQFLADNSIATGTSLAFNGNGLTPIRWITHGAHDEDDNPRWGDHFYTFTPTRVAGQALGLTDRSESLILPGNIVNSYVWGTVPNVPVPFLVGFPSPSPTNTETWECARAYEIAALTNNVQSDRNAYMAHTLYALGHILHLNQDLTSPDHVRNNAHLWLWHRWIENYGSETYQFELNAFPLEPHGWSYWQSQGFSKVLDFWDRGLYLGDASALDADASGSDKLGLAEFSNGNFLGEDATYAEFFTPGSIHYFPFPSLKNTTQPQLKPGNLAGSVDTITLKNLKQGNRVYISKTGAGVPVTHHSALNYLAVQNSPKLGNSQMQVTLTINDTNVLQEYHSILIPKAVEYSAGLLDYFFRGDIEVTAV